MQILTPTGYKPIEEIEVGDKVAAFDMVTGEKIINEVIDKKWMFDNPEENYKLCKFYNINNRWRLAGDLSIWTTPTTVKHISELEIGDKIYDDNDQEITVESIEEDAGFGWWRFHISGDASYIADGLTMHNASRFWILGTATWNNATTTNWAATSGAGSGGSSVPGSADVAIFDSLSGGGTVTLNYSPTLGGITGGAHTGTLVTGANTVTFASGRLDYSGTGTRTLNITNTTFNLVGQSTGVWNIATTTNLTFISTGSTISAAAGIQNGTFAGGGLTYNIVSLTGIGGGAGNMTGDNTFASLTIGVSASGRFTMPTGTNQTATNLTLQGTSATNFGMICTTVNSALVRGSQSTFTAANVTLSNIVLLDIIGAGAGTWSGTNVGDGGGCTNITFTSPVTRYWVATTGGNYAATTSWSTTSGGASGASIPLPQDTAVFPSNAIASSGRTITFNHSAYPSIDLTALVNNPTISFSLTNGGLYFFGDFTIGTNVTSAGINGVLFLGNATQNLTSNGHVFANSASTTISANGVVLNIVDALNGPNSTYLALTAGTLNINATVTIGGYTSSNSNVRTLAGDGTMNLTLNSNTIWSSSTNTNLTTTYTGQVNLTYSGSTGTRTITQGNNAANQIRNLNITAGTDIVSNSGCAAENINFTGFAGTFSGSSTMTISGNWTHSTGMTNTMTGVITFSSTTTSTITSNGVAFGGALTFNGVGANWLLSDNITCGTTRTITLTNGIFDANGYNVSTGLFSSSNSNTRSVYMRTGTWTLTGTGTVWNFSTTAGLTLDSGTSTLVINDTSASSKTLSIGANALTYNDITITSGGSAGQVIISQVGTLVANTIQGTGLANVQFKSATQYNIANFLLNGTAGNLCTITASTPGSPFTINKTSGIVSCNYLSLKDSTATGGATFYAGRNSTNVSGNTGWNFVDFFTQTLTDTISLTDTPTKQTEKSFFDTFSLSDEQLIKSPMSVSKGKTVLTTKLRSIILGR